MSDWFITDDDCLQCCRPVPTIDPDYYEFTQINSYPGHIDGQPFYQVSHGRVDVKDYTEDEINSVLCFYGYSDIDDFVLQNAVTDEFIYLEDGTLDRENSPGYIVHYQEIAEMFFETENQEYVVEEFKSWNDAVKYVSALTDLDVSGYLDKDLYLADTKEVESEKPVKLITTEVSDIPAASKNAAVKVSLHEAFHAAHIIADFLNDTSHSITPTVCITQDAKALLPDLMQPIIEADVGRDKYLHPMSAIKWGFEHMDYVKDMDDIFTKLGILTVQRHRMSTTQGEASVLCNGKTVVRYGDDIKLLSHGERDIYHDFCTTNGPLYGDIISGWGSTKPDESFRRAALTQYGKEIVRALTPVKSLDQMISAAKGKTHTTPEPHMKEQEFSR